METTCTSRDRHRASVERLESENAELRRRLEEAEETIRAIQTGAVDAFVVEDSGGSRVYTLQGADRPYRLLIEQMQQGAATVHAGGTILYCNRQLAALLNVPHEKLIGAALHDYVAPGERLLLDGLLKQGASGGGQAETHLLRADGPPVPVFLSATSLALDEDAATAVIVTDLTSQRHHEQLAAAQAALHEADRRKDEFLATLAHELRNPLAPIANSLALIEGTADAGVVAEARATMQRQLAYMVRLIDDLLDLNRITRDRLELRRERVDLASVIENAVELIRPLAASLKHDVQVTLPLEPLHVDADPARLTQVFGNLLNNACKYTEPGGRISLQARGDDGDVVVAVRDSGIGIAPDMLNEVFQMFAQVDHSPGRSGGLGIGLTLVKRLIEMHGGTVSAHSEGLGRGSEFVVRLPASTAQPDAVPPPHRPRTFGTLPRHRILVVDDNRDAARSLSMLLKYAGQQVQTVHDGLSAVDAAREFQPDVVLLDIGLPKLNGHEACRRIRELPQGSEAVVIALTGWGQDEDRQRSSEAGFDGHLVKPVDFGALAALIARCEAGARPSDGNAAETRRQSAT